jgi:hypothetical protein
MSANSVQFEIQQLIEFRRGQVRRKEFSPLGKLERIQFEKSSVAELRANPLTAKKQTVHLDWYNKGPMIALTPDHQDLLFCAPAEHPPALPDPTFVPKQLVDSHGSLLPDWKKRMNRPTIEQRLRDRASGILRLKEEWLVFQPVHQILLIVPGSGGGWVSIDCKHDDSGRHTTLIMREAHPNLFEAHILFGRHEINACLSGSSSQVWGGAFREGAFATA